MFFNLVKKGRNELWQYVFTIILIALGYFIGQIPLTALLLKKMDKDPSLGQDELTELMANPDFSSWGIDNNLGFLMLLLMFIFATIGLYSGIRFLHKKKIKDLITPNPRIDYSKILWAFGVWFLLGLIFEAAMYFYVPDNYAYTFNIKKFIPLVLIAFLILPIQTSFEELVFRGYFMQGFGSVLKNRWAPLIITSMLFGAIHGTNPEIEKYGMGIMQAYYITAGVVLGIMTIMDDSLELALGVHAGTNIYGAIVLSYEGAAIQTDTIVKTANMNPVHLYIVFLISALIFLLMCSKKFNWKSWDYLFSKIEFDDTAIA